MLDQRGRLLMAAVGFAGFAMPSYDRALWAMRSWLDSWSGIGHVTVGMHRLATISSSLITMKRPNGSRGVTRERIVETPYTNPIL